MGGPGIAGSQPQRPPTDDSHSTHAQRMLVAASPAPSSAPPAAPAITQSSVSPQDSGYAADAGEASQW